jgi:hypothetical protein
MLIFSAAGAYLLERAFAKNSPSMMLLSSGSLLLAYFLTTQDSCLRQVSAFTPSFECLLDRRPRESWLHGLPSRSQGWDSPGFFTQRTLKGWLPDILERKICVMLLTGTFHNFIIILSGITCCRFSSEAHSAFFGLSSPG